MIFQDGHFFVNTTGEYRIHRDLTIDLSPRMPVTIACSSIQGERAADGGKRIRMGDRTNQSPHRIHALDDKYGGLIAMIIACDQKDWNISDKAEDRGIAGASSGRSRRYSRLAAPGTVSQVISTIAASPISWEARVSEYHPQERRQAHPRIFAGCLKRQSCVRNRGGQPTYDPNWDWHAQNIKMAEALKERDTTSITVGPRHAFNKQGGAIMRRC